jgi:hypothetical protein
MIIDTSETNPFGNIWWLIHSITEA